MEKLTPDYIRDKLLYLGFSPANRGFHYIIEAEMIIDENPDAAHNLGKQIYTPLAEKNGCKWQAVERCVKTSIEAAMSFMPERVEEYLHLASNVSGSAYKNSDFLAAFHMALHRE